MKRRELKIGDIIQVGYNQVRVVHDEKVPCDGCYFRPICDKGYEALVWKQENFGFCSENERLDNINVHFELVE
jgi:hypothetical protein